MNKLLEKDYKLNQFSYDIIKFVIICIPENIY